MTASLIKLSEVMTVSNSIITDPSDSISENSWPGLQTAFPSEDSADDFDGFPILQASQSTFGTDAPESFAQQLLRWSRRHTWLQNHRCHIVFGHTHEEIDEQFSVLLPSIVYLQIDGAAE